MQGRLKGKVGETLATGDDAEAWRRTHGEGKRRQKRAEEEMDRRWRKGVRPDRE